MMDDDVDETWRLVVLVVSVFALLAAGIANVLLAVTESVLWPLVVGVGWVVAAAVVAVVASGPARSRSRTLPVEWVSPVAAAR